MTDAPGLSLSTRARVVERVAWQRLVRVCRWWAEYHMDQWERFSFRTRYGRLYVSMTYVPERPESYESLDKNGTIE